MRAKKIISYLLIGLFFFISSADVQAKAWRLFGQGTPTLQVGAGVAQFNQTVTVPIVFNSNGSNITSMIFSIDFDATCLNFVNAQFSASIPNNFSQLVNYQATDTDGEVDFSIFYRHQEKDFPKWAKAVN